MGSRPKMGKRSGKRVLRTGMDGKRRRSRKEDTPILNEVQQQELPGIF